MIKFIRLLTSINNKTNGKLYKRTATVTSVVGTVIIFVFMPQIHLVLEPQTKFLLVMAIAFSIRGIFDLIILIIKKVMKVSEMVSESYQEVYYGDDSSSQIKFG